MQLIGAQTLCFIPRNNRFINTSWSIDHDVFIVVENINEYQANRRKRCYVRETSYSDTRLHIFLCPKEGSLLYDPYASFLWGNINAWNIDPARRRDKSIASVDRQRIADR